MKKFLLIISILVISLSACGKQSDEIESTIEEVKIPDHKLEYNDVNVELYDVEFVENTKGTYDVSMGIKVMNNSQKPHQFNREHFVIVNEGIRIRPKKDEAQMEFERGTINPGEFKSWNLNYDIPTNVDNDFGWIIDALSRRRRDVKLN